MASYRRLIIFLLAFAVGFSAVVSTATAQTTMQREEMRERGELDEEDEQESTTQRSPTTNESASTSDSSTRRSRTNERERSVDDYVNSESYFVHIPGFRFDVGATFQENGETLGSYGIGLGYMYAWEYELMIIRSASKVRLGAGPDLMFITREWESLDAITGYLSARASGIGPRGGLTLEGGIGGATGRGGLRPLFKAGAFYASDNFEVGYYFQAPLGSRLDWLTTHHLAFRLNLPMFHH